MAIYPFDRLYLAVESSRSAFNEWHVCRKAHSVHISARVQIVQRIEHDREILIPFEIKLRITYVCMMWMDLDIGIEP